MAEEIEWYGDVARCLARAQKRADLWASSLGSPLRLARSLEHSGQEDRVKERQVYASLGRLLERMRLVEGDIEAARKLLAEGK